MPFGHVKHFYKNVVQKWKQKCETKTKMGSELFFFFSGNVLLYQENILTMKNNHLPYFKVKNTPEHFILSRFLRRKFQIRAYH